MCTTMLMIELLLVRGMLRMMLLFMMMVMTKMMMVMMEAPEGSVALSFEARKQLRAAALTTLSTPLGYADPGTLSASRAASAAGVTY